MEIKTYAQILFRRWWAVVPTFIVTCVAVLIFTLNQTPTYQAKATFVVRLNASLPDNNLVSALNILSSRAEIASTFAQVAISQSIKDQAAAEFDPPLEKGTDLSVDSHVIAGTNVMQIIVEGENPTLVWHFANAVGAKTLAYVQSLYEMYDLAPLDPASKPRSPVRPQMGLNMILGSILGLVLGAGFAFLLEYLQLPSGTRSGEEERPKHRTLFPALGHESQSEKRSTMLSESTK